MALAFLSYFWAFITFLPTLGRSAILIPCSIVCVSVFLARTTLFNKSLPPGPTLLTRLLERGTDEPLALKFARWGRQYGDVISLMGFVHFGKPTIVLGSLKAAQDLLEKRGNIYSSRPKNIVAEICYRESKGTLLQMGPKHRKFRSIMNATMSVDASKQFRPLQNVESKLLLQDLILEDNTDKYRHHIQRSIHSIAFFTAYGHRMNKLGPNHLQFFTELVRFFRRTALPGRHLVDHIPSFSHLPRSLQWFRKEPDMQGEIEERFFKNCLDQTVTAVSKGFAVICAAARGMERQSKFKLSELEITLLAASSYTAGVETTMGTFEAFIVAMILNPHIMNKAQKEIDAVVGPHRMPSFEDFDTLPYIRSIVRETLRWHPSLALGVPHAVTEDDVYDGMFIPAGSTVIANIYAITRNSELFPDPEVFRPERFLDNTDPIFKNYNITFGFGRRICPGQHVATDQLFSLISKVLWAFSINPISGGGDHSGYRVQHPSLGQPVPLPYKLVPRSNHVRSVIMEEALIADEEAKSWESFSVG